MHKYDLIVVGGGPAGCSSAFAVAKKGFKVLLVEKKKVGKLACGGLLPSKKELHSILPRAKNIDIIYEIAQNTTLQNTSFLTLVSPYGKKYRIPFEGISVDRVRFDNTHRKKCIDAGVEIFYATVKKLYFRNGRCVGVQTNNGNFSSSVTIGADGTFSTVKKYFKKNYEKDFAIAITTTIKRNCIDDVAFSDDEVYMHFGKNIPYGYGWLIPKQDFVNVGIGITYKMRRYLSIYFRMFLKKLNINSVKKYYIGYLPMEKKLYTTVFRNILLVGDSANQIMATNGGGIPIAMVCGNIAGEVVEKYLEENTPLMSYEQKWHAIVGKELKNSILLKRIADFSVFKSEFLNEFIFHILGEKKLGNILRCRYPIEFLNTKAAKNTYI